MKTALMKILYIEDNPGDVLLIKEVLTDALGTGFSLTVADRLSSGIKKLKEISPNVLLLDLGLPDSAGIETLTSLLSRSPEANAIPIIVLTGNTDESLGLLALKHGAQEYVVKGMMDNRFLVRLIRYAIERKKIEMDLRQSNEDLHVHQIELKMQTEELRKAQLALEEARDTYLDLYEFAPIGYLTLSDKALITDVNLTGATLLGVERNKLERVRFRKFVAPQDLDAWDRYFFSVLQHENKLTSTLTFTRGDGSVFPARLEGVRTTGSGGAITVRIAISDITDIWQIEALRETTEYLQNLINFASAPIIVWDPDFRITRFNHAFEHLTGRDEKEVIGQPLDILFPKESIDASLALIKKTLSGERWESVEIPILVSDGAVHTVLWNSANILTAEAELISTIAQGVDITERKQAEDALLESEEKYRLLIENANEAIMVAQDGMLKLVNRMTTELTGYPEQELTSKPFAGFIHPDDRAMIVENHTKRLRGDTISSRYQFRLLTFDGSTKWVEMGAVMIDWEGRPASLNFLTDITERKQAEEVLKSSESRYRRFFEAVRDGILIIDAETGMILDVNPFLIELLGFSHEQFLGKKLWEIGVFKDIAASKDNFKELQEKKYIHFEDLPLETADGRRIYSEFVSFVYDVEGKNVMQCNIRDITERKQAEDKLRRSEEQYRTFIETTNEGILSIDASLRIRFVNQKMAEILGSSPGEMMGKVITGFMYPEDLSDNDLKMKTRRSGKAEMYERRFRHRDGSVRWMLVLATPLMDNANAFAGSFAMYTDITERKRAEDTIALANRKLALMNDVAYQDIQNKVTALRGYAELSKDTKNETERSAFIGKEEKLLADIHQLIKNTKQFQEMGLNQPQWIPIEHEIRLAAALTSLETVVPLDADLHGLELYTDPLIGKVFFHLVDNAIKHGTGLTRITFSCHEVPDGLVLVCEDDGAGIDPHKRTTLFSRITGDPPRFGLFFVKEFLTLSGMTIAETGEPGKGARFEITVPKGMWRSAGKGASE